MDIDRRGFEEDIVNKGLSGVAIGKIAGNLRRLLLKSKSIEQHFSKSYHCECSLSAFRTFIPFHLYLSCAPCDTKK